MKKLLFNFLVLSTGMTLFVACSKQNSDIDATKNAKALAVNDKKLSTQSDVSINALANYFQVSGVGNEGSGADVKIADINGNGIPDILLMAIDNPAGENSFRYKFLMDVSPNGTVSTTTNVKIKASGMNETDGGAAAIGDIDRNGTPDLVLVGYDDPSGPNSFKYFIGWNLNSNGDPASWSSSIQVSGVSDFGTGAGVALADIDKNGILDMVLMGIDPGNASYNGRYKIGFNLSTSGTTSWPSNYKIFGSAGSFCQGGGLEIKDIDNNGQLEIIVMYNDHPSGGDNNFRTTMKPIDTQGNTGVNFSEYYSLGVGQQADGAGLAVGDIDRNGKWDFILMAYDNPAGINSFRYYISYNLILPIPWNTWFTFESCTCN